MSKYIFITGGVLSSLGKGLTSAVIGALLEDMEYKISFLKLDPYLNIDPGTMNPYQHGEVFVTQDGAETDLDLGHYERFTQVILRAHHSITAGKLYERLIQKERKGVFLGGTIQIVPHLTDAIKQAIYQAAGDADCTIVEIGGTVGDIEGLPFIEAIRQMGLYENRKNCVYVHLTYVPYLDVATELKTKPTQHAVKELCSLGIQPDILICRSKFLLPSDIKKKISLFTNVAESSIISAPDLETIYELPLLLAHEKLPARIASCLNLEHAKPKLKKWQHIIKTLKTLDCIVTIAIVGKYILLKDAYISLYEALLHAQIPTKIKINIKWINAEELHEKNITEQLKEVDAIIVPGGFGDRGIEGKIAAVRYAREYKIPFFGICLGMQMAVIEFARSVLKMPDAHSTELDPHTKQPVVGLIKQQRIIKRKGGTMRLGAQICTLTRGSKAFKIYQKEMISERHRHRYEFNMRYVAQYEKAGLIVSGIHKTHNLPEVIEIPDHPYFIACQFHPELQSKPFKPHPLFVALVEAARAKKLPE